MLPAHATPETPMSETLDTLLSRFPGDGVLRAIVLRPAREDAAVSVAVNLGDKIRVQVHPINWTRQHGPGRIRKRHRRNRVIKSFE